MSIKESARIAQSNNLMGLICRSSLLVSCASSPSYTDIIQQSALKIGN